MTLTPATINHPGQSNTWFDNALNRSFLVGLNVRPTNRLGVYLIDSTSRPGITYRVTATSCGCAGFQSHARCLHTSRVMFEAAYAAAQTAAAATTTGADRAEPADTAS